MASDPVLRMRIAGAVKERRIVRAKTVDDLKKFCGLDEVSNVQFGKALRSLHYNYGPIYLSRPYAQHMAPRPYTLLYVSATPAHVAVIDGLTAEQYLYVKFVRDFMSGECGGEISYTDYEFDSQDMVCVSGLGSAFELTSDDNSSLRAAIQFLENTGEIVVRRELVKERIIDRKFRPAESLVTLTLL